MNNQNWGPFGPYGPRFVPRRRPHYAKYFRLSIIWLHRILDVILGTSFRNFDETALVDRFGGPFFILMGFVALVVPIFASGFRARYHLTIITIFALGCIVTGVHRILQTKQRLLSNKPDETLTNKKAETSMAQLIASHRYLRDHAIQGEVFSWTYLGVGLILLATGLSVRTFPFLQNGIEDFAFVLSAVTGAIGICGLILFHHREKKLEACTETMLKRWDWLTAFANSDKLPDSEKKALQSGLIYDFASEEDTRSKVNLPKIVKLELEIARLEEENAALRRQNSKAS